VGSVDARYLVTTGDLVDDGHARGACYAGVVCPEYATVVGVLRRRRRGLTVIPSLALGFGLVLHRSPLCTFFALSFTHFLTLYATYADHEFLYGLFIYVFLFISFELAIREV
jgi:hypothetical protein